MPSEGSPNTIGYGDMPISSRAPNGVLFGGRPCKKGNKFRNYLSVNNGLNENLIPRKHL